MQALTARHIPAADTAGMDKTGYAGMGLSVRMLMLTWLMTCESLLRPRSRFAKTLHLLGFIQPKMQLENTDAQH